MSFSISLFCPISFTFLLTLHSPLTPLYFNCMPWFSSAPSSFHSTLLYQVFPLFLSSCCPLLCPLILHFLANCHIGMIYWGRLEMYVLRGEWNLSTIRSTNESQFLFRKKKKSWNVKKERIIWRLEVSLGIQVIGSTLAILQVWWVTLSKLPNIHVPGWAIYLPAKITITIFLS